MCGRFVSATPPEELATYFNASLAESLLASSPPPSFNVAPTNDILAVVASRTGRVIDQFHWGLVPSWAKDIKLGQKMINARGETLLDKAAFKAAFSRRRCLIPVDGFYEWKAIPGRKNASGKPLKQPMFIHRPDGEPLVFAGLWETWRDPAAGPDAPRLHSCTIITVAANETMAPIHDRMPAILAPSAWDAWLDPTATDLVELHGLLVPAPASLLTVHPVSPAVNNVREKGSDLIAPVAPEDSGTLI